MKVLPKSLITSDFATADHEAEEEERGRGKRQKKWETQPFSIACSAKRAKRVTPDTMTRTSVTSSNFAQPLQTNLNLQALLPKMKQLDLLEEGDMQAVEGKLEQGKMKTANGLLIAAMTSHNHDRLVRYLPHHSLPGCTPPGAGG
ncbi:uncharacterized protein [Littorina saxatilis]|uniref:uncharacterized protein n=1 Tax=Littorina saxatilis TaxID=31220 RepID=UPI0038B6274D